MKNFIFNKGFQLGFWLALASVVIFNLMTLTVPDEKRFRHVMNKAGFPMAFYEWGGDPYVERFITSGIIIDIAVALVYSLIVGSILGWLWQQDFIKKAHENNRKNIRL